MNVVNILAAIDMLLAISAQARVVSDRIKAARAENRDISDVELDALATETGQALANAKAAGAAAKTREDALAEAQAAGAAAAVREAGVNET